MTAPAARSPRHLFFFKPRRDVGVAGMSLGERAKLTIPPEVRGGGEVVMRPPRRL